MSEVVFPVLGTAFVFLVLPLCALVAKGVLVVVERDDAIGPLHGLNLRYLVLIASSSPSVMRWTPSRCWAGEPWAMSTKVNGAFDCKCAFRRRCAKTSSRFEACL
jgi:hypothetical protein